MPLQFTTDRLVLRPFRHSDAAALVACLNVPEMARGLSAVPYPYTDTDAAAYLDMVGTDTFAVTYKDRLVGAVGLGAQLGYWVATPYWGEGIATEACTPLLNHHFAHSDVPVRSSYVDDNAGSAAVLRKLGFVITGAEDIFVLSRDCAMAGTAVVLTQKVWEATL